MKALLTVLLSLLLEMPTEAVVDRIALEERTGFGEVTRELDTNASSEAATSTPMTKDNTKAEICEFDKIKVNPFIHKSQYTIGVHATRGLDAAFQETNQTFGEYLSATAGQKFDPPIEFKVVPNYFDGLFNAIENKEMDFLYANPGVYSCIGTQVGATALGTVIKELETRGRSFNLDVYGGVIAVRHDNDEVNTIADLKDKIIGAGAIIDLMGGQMQIYEMGKAGLSYVNDPKQMVFTKDQVDVVRGLLSGRFDVGFIRTDQIELTRDEDGELVDPNLFKIIAPKIYVMDDGELFPFLHSTEIFPEWPFAALPSVPSDVQQAVQDALLDFGDYALVGDKRAECLQLYPAEDCNAVSPRDQFANSPCDTTIELADLSSVAARTSHISGFRTARSYFELRTMQEEAGFLVQDKKDNWYCTRPANLYDGITCPRGYFKRREDEFHSGCAQVGLDCADNTDYDCFCKPCVEAYEVDVYEHVEGDKDPHLTEYYGKSLPGCEKMSICGTIEQGESITLRIFDNMMRDGAEVKVIAHAGDNLRDLNVQRLPGTFAYEFSLTDKTVQVQVIDISFDGEPISQSPIRVIVQEKNCEIVHGPTSNRVPDPNGNCVCAGNTYEMGGTCLDSAYFFLIIFSAVFIALGVLIFIYLGYKKKQSDSVWHIGVEELHFNEPPEIIGQGGFGVVILGQYRGTKVAVKRVLPPSKASGRHSASLTSDQKSGLEGDTEIAAGSHPSGVASTPDNKGKMTGSQEERMSIDKQKRKGDTDRKKQQSKKEVKFGDATAPGDIESQSLSKRGSLSGSNGDWERLMMMHHSDNDILKILESATSSDHGSGGVLDNTVSRSRSQTLLRWLPMWVRFDEHSRKVNEFIVEMRMLSRLRHPCITTVMGAVIARTVDPMLVMEFMEYGSLYDLLHNETMTPGGDIILQVVRDIVQGIQFLHASKPPILHGDLKAKNILVDSRFRAKVADFGFSHFKASKQRNGLQGTPFYMAPEYLRRRSEYTTECDIYSLAMIIYEIYERAPPFDGQDPRKILPKICHPRLNKRPSIPESCPPRMVELMKKCWSANAFFRPSAKDIDYVLVEMNSNDAEPLESKHDQILENLKRKPTSLYDVFPKHIADALNAGKKVEAESHEIVTIVFSDIVGFTTISERFSPMKVSTMLDRLYHAFDKLADKHHVFKVETIGDAYMGVTNLDGSEFDTHVKQATEYAEDAIRATSQILIDEDDPALGYVQIRVGIHSGPVVSNVIGSLNPRYGLFGDTVNTASRMESNSMPGKIHCSFASADLLRTQAPDIPVTLRGMIKVKGKGKMKTYWVGNGDILSTPLNSLLNEDQEASISQDDEGSATDHHDDDVLPSVDDECSDTSDGTDSDHDVGKSQIANNNEKIQLQNAPPTSSSFDDNGSQNSHGTHSTLSISLESSSEVPKMPPKKGKKDHFIAVHYDDETGAHQATIQMDGNVQKRMTAEEKGLTELAQMYAC